MKKALVIGGSGFMGSHTADELSKNGYEVTIFDKKISPWILNNQKIIIGDLLNLEELIKAAKGMDYIYHFAGVADIGEAKKNPYKTISMNVMGVINSLEAAIVNGVKRFIFASSMYVYSNQGSFYRASKQAAETLIEAYAEELGIEYTFLRFGSLYGPRSQKWNGIRSFVEQILKNEKLVYGGNGLEMREYIHVFDAARLSVDILHEKYNNSAITITGQQLFKVDDFFSILFEILGKEKSVEYQNKSSLSNHYGNTPYRYSPKTAKKIVPQEFVDLGQGILNLIEEIKI